MLVNGVPEMQASLSPRRSVLHSAVSTTSAFHRNALSPPICSMDSSLFRAQVEESNPRRWISMPLPTPEAPHTLRAGSGFLRPDYRVGDTCPSGPGPVPILNSVPLLQPHSVRWLSDTRLVQLNAQRASDQSDNCPVVLHVGIRVRFLSQVKGQGSVKLPQSLPHACVNLTLLTHFGRPDAGGPAEGKMECRPRQTRVMTQEAK